MKLLFFLQESRGVPLNYHFSLYSYGPFDSDVLADISSAERLNVLKSATVYYPSGIGYEYSPGPDVNNIKGFAREFLDQYRESIDWAVAQFSRKPATELELLSTILFVAKYQNPGTSDRLIEQVKLIKSHFSLEEIGKGFDDLVVLNVLIKHNRPATAIH